MPIDYSQYLNANQRGLDTLNQTRLATLDRPTGVQSFLSGLQGGQERMEAKRAQQQAMSDKQRIEDALRRRQEAQDAISQEEREYKISQRPMDEEKTRLSLEQLKYNMTPKPVAEPSMTPYQQARIQLEQAKLNRPSAGGGAPSVDKSTVPGTAEWKRVQDVETKSNQADLRKQDAVAGLDELDTLVTQLKQHPGLKGLTGMRGIIPDVPGSPAFDAEKLRENINSQTGLRVLAQLKTVTGAGLGSVTEAEHKLLQGYLANLGRGQSAESYAKNLQQITDWISRNKQALSQTKAPPQPAGTQTTVRGGKTYYMWDDGNWHSKAPQ
jgi:hypothetical protein